jgi:hypothetical protein
MLVRAQHPQESLHYLYAILAFGLVPVTDNIAEHGGLRTRAVWRLLGASIVLAVIVRLFATG